MIFKDRREAGRVLAKMLKEYCCKDNYLVVALPRGGVEVGYEIAKELKLPLEIFFTKKIPSPYNEEVAVGAVSEDKEIAIDPYAANLLKLDNSYYQKWALKKLQEIEEKRRKYKKALPSFKDKGVILTDDGVATGASIILAAKAIKNLGAKEIIIAVPVAPTQIYEKLKEVANRVVVAHLDSNLVAVGRFYQDFHQLSDEEVISYLKEFE
ncbi:MAG: phosphoribosyltransferase [Epsilonproteobacteria bacterium]|nr:phosphoribosyltransferase [Campylobacterota bacterium]